MQLTCDLEGNILDDLSRNLLLDEEEADTTDLVASLLDPSDLVGALDAAGLRDPATAALDLLTVYEGLLWERTVGRLAGAEVDVKHDAELLGAVLARHEHRGPRNLFGLRR